MGIVQDISLYIVVAGGGSEVVMDVITAIMHMECMEAAIVREL